MTRHLRATLVSLLMIVLWTISSQAAPSGAIVCTGVSTNFQNVTCPDINEEIVNLDRQGVRLLSSVAGTDTITANASPYALTAYSDGQTFRLKPANDNTSTVTLSINSLGAKAIVTQSGTALAAGDLDSGTIYIITYYGSDDHFRVMGAVGTPGADDDVPETGDFTNLIGGSGIDNNAGTLDLDMTEISSGTWGAGSFTSFTFNSGAVDPVITFGSGTVIWSAITTYSLDDEAELRFNEEDAGGSNYIGFKAPAAITSNVTCTFENDANPIPDSCVGDGTDSTGSLADGDYTDITVSGSGLIWNLDADVVTPTELAEAGNYDFTGTVTFDSDALQLDDTNASHQLILTPGSDLTTDRVLTFTTGDAARTLTLTDNVSLGDADLGDITSSSDFTVLTIDADSVALTTDTTGVYVAQVADGTGIDGTANAEGATYTPTLDLTEINSFTLGAGAATGIIFDAGATDPAIEVASGTFTIDIGGTNELVLNATNLNPGANDGNSLGQSGTAWADLFLATGGLIEFDGGTTNTLTCTGGNCTIEGNGLYRVGGTDVAVADGGTGASSLTDLIALTTHTTGNYVQQVADGTGVDGSVNSEGGTYTPTLDFTEISSATWGAGSFTTFTFDAGATDPLLTFGSGTLLVEAVTSLRQADAANAGGSIRLLEDPGTGSNFIALLAPAAITSDVTCTLENDANPIPDSCVGDGTDGGGTDTLGPDGDKGDVTVGGTGTTLTIDADSVALGTDTTNDYVATAADGTGIDGTATGEGSTYTPTLDLTEISSATWGAGSFTTLTYDAGATDPVETFGSGTYLLEAVASFRQADAANAGGQIKLLEDPGTGSNFISFLAPASITSDVTCTFENDGNPIPDSCVGDGVDDGAGGSGDNIRVEDGDNGGTFTASTDADFEDGAGDINFVLDVGTTPDQISGVVRPDSVALVTDTTGNIVTNVGDGTGIDGTCSAENCTYTPTLDLTEINSATWGDGSFTTFTYNAGAVDPTETFGSGTYLLQAVASIRQADAANAGGQLSLLEDPGTGGNFLAFLAPASITSDATCTLENDANFIPDSCVGDGSDDDVPEVGDFGALVGGSGIDNNSGTLDLDLTELNTFTLGAGSATGIIFDAGATDPAIEVASGSFTIDIGGTNELVLNATNLTPGANDGNALGTSGTAWADLFLAAGGLIEFDGGTTNSFTCTGGNCTIEGNGVYRAGGTDVAVADGGTGASTLNDLITLSTHTTGSYVQQVADGTGVDGTANAEGATYTPTLDLTEISSATWGAGSFTTFTFDAGAVDPLLTFGSGTLLVEGVTSFRQADAANAGGFIKLLEDPGTGSNFIGFQTPAAITSDVTCTLENDGNPIPDSCVGDGVDDGAGSAAPTNAEYLVKTLNGTLTAESNFVAGTGLTATDSGANAAYTVDCDTPSETAVGCIELATTAEAEAGTDTTRAVTAAGVLAAVTGKKPIWLPAGSLVPRTTNGCQVADLELGTNDIMLRTCNYDTTTEEGAGFTIRAPDTWNEGSVSFVPVWTHPSTTTNFGVVWSVSCLATSNDDAMDAALGTPQTSTDTGGTTSDQYTGPESAAITCAGTPQAGDTLYFEIERTPGAGSDTLAVDAYLLGVTIYYTDNSFVEP